MAAASALDWSLVQAFLTVAEQGSLSAAARSLGASQPTVGRQIRSMEEQLGAELFRRHGQGLALTDTGTSLLGAARAMRQAVHEIELSAAGKGKTLEGTVRVTASVAVAVHHLPPLIAALRVAEPSIAIELVPDDETSNLHYREADIAVRMYRPSQLDLVTLHLGDLVLSAFAARSYVERRGVPRTHQQLLEHDFVGMDRHSQIIDGFKQAGFVVDREWFKVRTDDYATYWALVRAGCGIGFAQAVIGRDDPELVELPMELGLPTLPIWLTTHETIRHARRIARVWDAIADGLRAVIEHQTL